MVRIYICFALGHWKTESCWKFWLSGKLHFWKQRRWERISVRISKARLANGCEARPLRVQSIRCLVMFDARFLRNNARVCWEQRISNPTIWHNRFLVAENHTATGSDDLVIYWECPLRDFPFRCWLRTLDLAGSQAVRKLTQGQSRVGPSRFPGWDGDDQENR